MLINAQLKFMKKSQDIDLKKGTNYSQILQWLYIPLKKTGLLNVPLCMLSEVETTVLFNFSLFIMEAEKERERFSDFGQLQWRSLILNLWKYSILKDQEEKFRQITKLIWMQQFIMQTLCLYDTDLIKGTNLY